MEQFEQIRNDLQQIAIWQTNIHNKLIDVRLKLKSQGWYRVIVWGSEYYISPNFYKYIDSNNLSVYEEKSIGIL